MRHTTNMDQHQQQQQQIKSTDLDRSPHRPPTKDERRSSVAAPGSTKQRAAGATTDLGENSNNSDTRRPLTAVMSEDFLSSAPFLTSNKSSPPPPPIASTQKQSFLSKFSRSEVKTSNSVDKSSRHKTSEQSNNESSNRTNKQPLMSNNSINNYNNNNETESDKGAKTGKSGLKQSSLASNMPESRASKSFCEGDVSDSIKSLLQRVGDIKSATPSGRVAAPVAAADDDNQVLPAWPSRIEAAAALEPASVQHQVYSLKDYSQVAGPTESVASSNSAPNARLQKSMSQDRKVGSRTKRMSECILSGASIDASKGARQQRLPSMIGKISASSNLSHAGQMNPASSVNSLLLPTSGSGKTPALISESRIDRMRKLFVSPLSLRGSTSGTGGSSKPSAQTHSTQSRLSLQAGANMLNKPHHLMHMYRARVAVGAHHSRRSPMRQKQGNMKGFRVYGCPLSMANTMYPITCFGRPDIYKQQAVPYILARLCNYIEENSSQLTHEGIFRVSGNARLMEKLKTLFDHLGDAPLESESVDVATSASMLKMYLRELPDPLIPTRMNYYFFTLAKKYSSLLYKSGGGGGGLNGFRLSDNPPSTTTGAMANEASSVSDSQSTLDRHKMAFLRDLTKLIRKLPIENYNLLKYLACFLHRISLRQQSNKMSAEALGIVFGPNVFRIRSESYKGLKEQELSNQIMASIISNYKQIFDCELTDPLGNLIKSGDDLLRLSHELEGVVEGTKPGQSSEFPSEPSCSRASKSEHTTTVGGPTVVATTHPATSAAATTSTYESVLHHQQQQKRCPKHGRPVYRYNEDDDDDDESDDEDATVDDDDEDEECDEDSYGETSDSGSYCSSLASDTVESTYEGDVEGEGPYDDDEDDDDDDDDEDDKDLAGTSSDCGSETSYTPSSSHSDSDDEDAGAELSSSSNFSSNASLTGANDAADKEMGPSGHKSCSVCRRRESAQVEAAAGNKMREQLRAASTAASSGLISEKSERQLSNSAAIADERLDDDRAPSGRPAAVAPESTGQHQLARQNHGHRVSTRRKRGTDDCTKRTKTHSPSEQSNDLNTDKMSKSIMSSSDISLNAAAAAAAAAASASKAKCTAPSSSSSAGHLQHGSRQIGGHRHSGLLRRRSSSASSLLRIAQNRHERSAHGKRGAAKDAAADHNRHHYHRTRGAPGRHRFADQPPSRGFSRKSTRSNRAHQQPEPRNHASLGLAQQVAGATPDSASVSASNAAGCGFKWNNQGDYYVPDLLTLNLSPQNRRDLVWNYVSSALLDLPESERFFQLRSYNSDETLLRSQPETADATAFDEPVGALARRRFSGQDHLQANQHNLLANACTEFNQIFEAYEGENGVAGGGDPLAVVEAESLASDLLRPRGLSSNVIDSSMVSLLGDQMLTFEHSTLSLDSGGGEDPPSDPIVAQLKVTRDLVKALQRLVKHGTANGFNQDVSAYLLGDLLATNSSEPASAHEPDAVVSSSYIDHLTGKSIVESLDNLKRDVDDLPKVDLAIRERLIELLGAKIAELKKRYNNLKYIREHYHRHHLARSKQQAATISSQPGGGGGGGDAHRTPEESSPASHSIRSDQDALSIDSTSNNHQPAASASHDGSKRSSSCKFGSLCPVEFVFNIEKHLAARRLTDSRQICLNEMTLTQLQSEKLELQKNLLRYEHWFGRPTARAEFNLVGHLYERYRAVKIIKQRKSQATD